ncbi:hypothetical protein FGB62_411g00 [Gracilaria domingensis]|nr:hypothetical protein FGB62_411g00 [Gracilaria domingensis]
MMDAREDESVAEVVENVHLHSSGVLDTSYGAVLTTEAAMSLMRLSAQSRQVDKQKNLAAAAEREQKEAI